MSVALADINVSMYGQFVTFTVYPTAVIPTQFTNVQVLDVLSYRTAARITSELAAMHASVYPSIPTANKCPNDPTLYNYLVLGLPGGQTTVIGIPWIDLTSFNVVNYIQLNMQVSAIGNSDVIAIKEAMAALGYNNVSYTVVTS